MNRPRRIVIAAERSETLTFLQQIVQSLGHEVVAALLNGRELIEACRATSPELVITEVKIPEVDGLAALHQLNGQATFPIIIISDSVDGEVLDRANQCHVYCCLMQPVKEADLQAAISIAMGRFEQLQLLKKEADDVRQTLQNRKIIERAKGILMMRGKLSEPEAFHRLQKLSWDKNKKLVDIAQIVITAEGGAQSAQGLTTTVGTNRANGVGIGHSNVNFSSRPGSSKRSAIECKASRLQGLKCEPYLRSPMTGCPMSAMWTRI